MRTTRYSRPQSRKKRQVDGLGLNPARIRAVMKTAAGGPFRLSSVPMPAVAQISETLIREIITRAVSNVFKMMLGHPVLLRESGAECLPKLSARQVVGTVGFVGDASGLIHLYLGEAFANHCTRQVLGLSEFEIRTGGDTVVNDAIGELTNMVAGSFKSALCDAGYPCKLAIPSILRGHNFCIERLSSAVRHLYHFECGEHSVITDIIVKSCD
jgi:chemotaxis protein CheX